MSFLALAYAECNQPKRATGRYEDVRKPSITTPVTRSARASS
jgi:hypothetical protein